MTVPGGAEKTRQQARLLASIKMEVQMREILLTGGFDVLEREIAISKQRLLEEFRDHPFAEGWIG